MPPDELEVPVEAAGQRLDAWLAAARPGLSRTQAANLIDAAAVLVDGVPRPKRHRLRGGERIEVAEQATETRPSPTAPAPRIAWQNDDLLVIDKPAGLVVHPAPGHTGATLVELLARDAGTAWEPLAVHRLDRDTSGLMLVAKRPEVRDELQQLIRARGLVREYLALAEGTLGSRSGTIEAPIGRDARDRTRMAVGGARAREARTHFEVERPLEGFTLVRAQARHRAHASDQGPLRGDRPPAGRRPRLRRAARARAGAAVPAQRRIAFEYSGAARRAVGAERSPLPADLAEALEQAGQVISRG